VAKLTAVVQRQHQVLLARVQVISEINHHVRNALMAISASAYLSRNQDRMRVISESVERIDWALREILPRKQPLPEVERARLMFVMSGGQRGLPENDELDLHLSIGGRK
jgi:hypothetical protein